MTGILLMNVCSVHITVSSLFALTAVVYRFYLGVPEGQPGQLHLYVVSSAVPRVGTPLTTPQCLTCAGSGLASSTHYEGAATASSSVRESYDWEEVAEAATTTEEPERKRRKRKGWLSTYTYSYVKKVLVLI